MLNIIDTRNDTRPLLLKKSETVLPGLRNVALQLV